MEECLHKAIQEILLLPESCIHSSLEPLSLEPLIRNKKGTVMHIDLQKAGKKY